MFQRITRERFIMVYAETMGVPVFKIWGVFPSREGFRVYVNMEFCLN